MMPDFDGLNDEKAIIQNSYYLSEGFYKFVRRSDCRESLVSKDPLPNEAIDREEFSFPKYTEISLARVIFRNSSSRVAIGHKNSHTDPAKSIA